MVWIIWKVSKKSGKFPDSLEISGLPGKVPYNLGVFRMVRKVSGKSGKFFDNLESFGIIWKVLDDPKNP